MSSWCCKGVKEIGGGFLLLDAAQKTHQRSKFTYRISFVKIISTY